LAWWVSAAGAADSVYWANYAGDKISYANADGSGAGGDVNTTGATVFGPNRVAVDPTGGRIYWSNLVAGGIAYCGSFITRNRP
jgi:hypothetical protein